MSYSTKKKELIKRKNVTINGVTMGMFIESADLSNPVLLFIHGGPGMPEYFMCEEYDTKLWNDFTVVWWDQRGAGLSVSKKVDYSTITTQVLVDDTIAVTNYLRQEFHQDKIYLMAHSWGSYIGIQAVKKAPELYHAYIGVGQMVDQPESEQLAYDYMVKYFKRTGQESTVKKLLRSPYPSRAYNKIRDQVMHHAGIGTTHTMRSVAKEICIVSLHNPEYTIREKFNLWYGKIRSTWIPAAKERDQTDFRETLTSVEIPVYLLSGQYDYTVNYQLVMEYERLLSAPCKGFYLFENCAHSPIFENADQVCKIMREDVLLKQNKLTDQK